MDSSFGFRNGHGEDEPMLGIGSSTLETRSSGRLSDEPYFDSTQFSEKAKAKQRRCDPITRAIIALFCLTLLMLPVFLILQPPHDQALSQNSHDHDAGHGKHHSEHHEEHHVEYHGHEQHGHPTVVFISTSSSSETHATVTSTQASVPASPSDDVSETEGQQSDISTSNQFDLNTGFVISSTTQVREYAFNITQGTGEPDGVSKPMLFINGQSPGPLIEANTGDTIRVVVHNNMPTESTSIHWHGIDQRDSVWMDGVQGVTQCAIPPGEHFTYEFSLPDQRGTFWYHAHVGVQYTDGLYGPLIIHDPDERIPVVDDDKILMIGDVFHGDSDHLLTDFLGPSPPWSPRMPGMDPPPDNMIMNGHGVFDCSIMRRDTPHHDPFHDMVAHGALAEDDSDLDIVMDADVSAAPPAECTGGSRYKTRIQSWQSLRLRLVSHSTATPFWFTIDNHTLDIFEIDGVEVEPISTSRVFMYPGQRYSVLVVADQTPGNYLMRAQAAHQCFHMPMHHHKDSSAVLATSGILSYDDVEDDAAPIGSPWDLESTSNEEFGSEPWEGACVDLPFGLAKPVRAMNAYEVGARNHHYFTYWKSRARTFINDTVFEPPEDDAILWGVLDHAAEANGRDLGSMLPEFDPEHQVLVSHDADKAAQIVINSDHMMSHPWHLHGQNFQIVGWGKGLYGEGETHWNLENPLRRDTIVIPGESHVILRIKADNPGVWAFHCHILWHAEGGMFVTIAQQLDKLRGMLGSLDASDADQGIKNRFCAAHPDK